MAGSVNQNSQFDLGARKLFFVPASKTVLQQYRPRANVRGAFAVIAGLTADTLTRRSRDLVEQLTIPNFYFP